MYARIYCIYHACMPAPSSSIMPGFCGRDNGHKALCPLSVFVTPDALNFLVWNLAKRPAEGQEEQAFQREMVAQQVHWAQIIQSCAPGSTVRSLSTLALLCFGQSVGSSDSILLPLPCSVPILCVRFLCSVFSGLCLSGSAISALFFFTSISEHVPSLHCPVS